MKTNDMKCHRLREFITMNDPERIDRVVENLDMVASLIIDEQAIEPESALFALRQLETAKRDYRELRELSVLFNQEKAA